MSESKFKITWEDGYDPNVEDWSELCKEIADRNPKLARVAIVKEYNEGFRVTCEFDEALRSRIERGEYD